MKVTRKVTFKTDNVCVGDQITIKLERLGKFTATAQKVNDDSIDFLFDQLVTKHSMNATKTNAGGFERSDLSVYLKEILLPKFSDKLCSKIIDITLPSYGQIFGHDEFYKKLVEPDGDERFELMGEYKNRIRLYNNKPAWWWLRNVVRNDISSSFIAFSGPYGFAADCFASCSLGVCPLIRLAK